MYIHNKHIHTCTYNVHTHTHAHTHLLAHTHLHSHSYTHINTISPTKLQSKQQLFVGTGKAIEIAGEMLFKPL